MRRAGIVIGIVLAGALVAMGWLSFSRDGRRAALELACRHEDDRVACCALGAAMTGDPAADADYVELLRHACVDLDPAPEDPLAAECSCAVLLDAAGSTGLLREDLYAQLEFARCERTGRSVCPRPALRSPTSASSGSTPVMSAPRPSVTGSAASDTLKPYPTGIPGIDIVELDANITPTSATSWTINRSLVDHLRANQAALMSAARAIPHEEAGRAVGIKLYGIRRSSLLGRLGVQNGDMLRSLNGHRLDDPDEVLDAYSTLRTADHITLALVRRGTPISFEYTIR